MDEKKVNVVGSELFERRFYRSLSSFISGIGNPDFRCDKEFLSRKSAFCNRISDSLFVSVSLSSVDTAIPHLDGIQDASLGLLRWSLVNSIYKYGTLTKVAEIYFTSQPTLTRTMKRVEQEFGVPLFVRTANRIELNETGKTAARLAEKLLDSATDCVTQVRDFDRNLHTITVESCAPAPLWSFIPELTERFSGKTISSKFSDDLCELEEKMRNSLCDVVILPYPIAGDEFICKKYVEEHLSICVPPEHELAKYSELTADIINGYNCLLSSEIGFWNDFCRRKLPASKFLVQTDEFAFAELIRESTLPCFTTNLAMNRFGRDLAGRITIPITDDVANVTYYIVYRKDNERFSM